MKKFYFFIFAVILMISSVSQADVIKIDESFTGVTFPPTGWSRTTLYGSGGAWARSTTTPRTAPGCAFSTFVGTGQINYLKTPSFACSATDSVIFWFRHSFSAGVVRDSFQVRLSTTDTAVSSFTNQVFYMSYAGYPTAATYFRYAVSLSSFAGNNCYLAFMHQDFDGDGIRLDDIQVIQYDPPVQCNIVITNLNPTGTVVPGCGTNYVPKVNIFNNGSDPQSNITVTYDVPSVGYSSPVSGLSLAPGANMDVTFPNLLLTSANAGVRNVTVTANSTCSGAQSYVLNTSFTVDPSNPNFGGPIAGYYWTNSSSAASCAPDQPIYYWEDTTGSTSLFLNGLDVSGGLRTGSVDDGFFRLGGILGAGHAFKYMGVDYDSFYVGTNGMIAFTRAYNTDANFSTSTPIAIPSATAPRPAIFPFWKDLNYGDADVPINRLSYKAIGNKLIITYDRAPIFGAGPNDYVSFQVILETPVAPTTNGMVVTQFDNATSGSDFLIKYNTLTLTDHTVGIQDLAGSAAIQYRRAVGAVVTNAGPLFSSPLAIAFGPNQGVLPVELASFTASTNNNEVTLNWSTATERNNSGFDIERSASNGAWSKVGNVAGNGTTVSPMNYSFTDRNVASGNYSYRLKQIDFNGNFEYFNLSNEVNVGIPTKFDLSQNYPNPFNPSTSINYEIPFDGKVSLKIFDMAGKEVATLVNEVKTAGYYTYNFNASNLSSGVYFYSLSANNFTATKKMMLLK